MSETFQQFWWLIFPIMFFVFGGFNRWMHYRHQRDTIDLLRTYAAQGKEPPPEVARMATDPESMQPYSRWNSGGWGRCPPGPYREWRRVVFLASLATGFGLASYFTGDYGSHQGFFVAAVIIGTLALGSLLFAVLSSRAFGSK